MSAYLRPGLLALVLLAVALSACGKRGQPEPPAGEPNTYPRVYPSE
jgi:predicted small lipoprotein YifL